MYFSHEVTRVKLSILYLLRALDLGLTRQQIVNIFVGNNWLQYFELLNALAELETDGFVAAIPSISGQCYRLTQSGLEMIKMLKKQIPISLRDEYDAFASSNRDLLKREMELVESIHENANGTSVVTLSAIERNTPIIQISLTMPDNKSAALAAKRWDDCANDIYAHIMGLLVGDR